MSKKLDFNKLTDKELYSHLNSFYKLNINFWLIVHVPEVANWGGEYLLRKKLQRLSKEKAEEYLEILSAPVKFSFFQQEELDLLKLDYIKNKEVQLKKDENSFLKLLPELINKQNFKGEPQEAKVYVGIEGIKTLYQEILNQFSKGDEYLAMTFSNSSLDNPSIIGMFQKFHQKRGETKAKAKILSNNQDTLTIEKMNYSSTPLYEFRITKQVLPTGIAIAKNMVITFNWGKNPTAFVINCKENANQYRKFFYDTWKEAKPVKK